MGKKRLESSKGLPAPKLTKAQTKILREFSTNAKDLARRLRQEARRAKSSYISGGELPDKEGSVLRFRGLRPNMSPHRKGVLTKKTGLNTWLKEASGPKARMMVTRIMSGKNKGLYRDKATGKLITKETLDRRGAAYRYHSAVRHIHKVLGGSYAKARKAYKAFLIAGVLKAIEFES